MKKRNLFWLVTAALLTLYAACVKDLEKEGIYTNTNIIGSVVEKSTLQPIEGVLVQITDGTHIHASVQTNSRGAFVLEDVNFEEVNNDYYLWIDGSQLQLPSKQEELKGVGRKVYDYKAIVLYDKTNAALLPVVKTDSVTEVSAVYAKVKGEVISDGGHEVTQRGVCYATHQTPTLDDSVTTAGKGQGYFTCSITGLAVSTTYYVRAYATNSIGTVYGAQKTFTTTSGFPVVSTDAAANVTATSAKCGGNVSDNGGFTIISRGICWNSIGNPDTNGSHLSSGTGNGTFNVNLTGLEMGKTYHVRAYAVNQMGISYGNEINFTTSNGMPSFGNDPVWVKSIKTESVVCYSEVIGDGGFPVIAKGFCWSTNQYPTIDGDNNNLGTGTGKLTGSITGLTRNTTYYVRAYATNSQGTSYSEQNSFTTANGLPTVTTTAVTMNGKTAVSGGNVTSDGGYPVTERGICYGVYPNPDLTSAYIHTSDGSGTGYFSSIIDSTMTGTVYVRAYATNSSGTAYGNQITVNYDYLALPSFTFNGHTYKVAPLSNNFFKWSDAKSYCDNLTSYGYNDWTMPTKDQLLQMYEDRQSIGGFGTDYYWSSTYNYAYSSYYDVSFSSGSVGYDTDSYNYKFKVRPIRKDK